MFGFFRWNKAIDNDLSGNDLSGNDLSGNDTIDDFILDDVSDDVTDDVSDDESDGLIITEESMFSKIGTIFGTYIRLQRLCYIFMSHIIKHYMGNFVYKHFTQLPIVPRIDLIINITGELEAMNIIYVKIFQSMCLEKNILNIDEKEYLLKYTDSVPYKNSEIDYGLLNLLNEKYNITLDSYEPINSGVIGIVFSGIKDSIDNKVVIKMLKNDISQKLHDAYAEIELVTNLTRYIPHIRKFGLHKLFLDNKQIIFDQLDFEREVCNLEIFKFKNQNLPEYRIPYVYKEITNELKNVIIMENIKGLTISDIKLYDQLTKEKFSELLIKFGFMSIFYHNTIHCDMHAGNIFFYINDDESILPKYQLGFLDFGLCMFLNKENQNAYYKYFYELHYNKKFENIDDFRELMLIIVEEKNILSVLIRDTYDMLMYELVNLFKKYTIVEMSTQFLGEVVEILTNYGFTISQEFNQLCLSTKTVESLSKTLTSETRKHKDKVMTELVNINKLISIV